MAAHGTTETVTVWKKEVILESRPQGLPTDGNVRLRELEFTYTRPLHDENSVVLKVLFISIDPYVREIMNEDGMLTGIPSLKLGELIRAYSVSKVVATNHRDFKEGDIVFAITPVTNYVLIRVGSGFPLRKIKREDAEVPLANYLGVLGMPGHTAWLGLNIITQLNGKEELYVSAAAGAVGLLAGQLAKLKGCRVVGSAGSDEKVKLLKEVYKYDDAFNYKTEKDWEVALKRRFPDGIDVYFENVGGRMLEAVLDNIKKKGRIVVCGMISQYNKKSSERNGVRNLMLVVGKSLRMEGFLEGDFPGTWDAFLDEVSQYLQEGKIKYDTDVLGRGIEEFTKALVRLLKGENTGKAVLFVSNE
ncbi:hypothetical protein L7F22_030799 [Adiantum nelumboides]|nr:hypothetical protein [Adiantum nelumboides]